MTACQRSWSVTSPVCAGWRNVLGWSVKDYCLPVMVPRGVASQHWLAKRLGLKR
ncbi:hypothetical protein O3S68_15620 [Kosakonia sp. SOY2]|uniref:hypothetical protein n=1 Tax=Kosakonia sp. SOY2 TaxID=3014557 RepID=UPI0022AC556E|nr:hypothetical protein [Kosakonia sp. SOY2]MCZ3383715.1 hypothetical protein [Kosakonia sp. SOY2]